MILISYINLIFCQNFHMVQLKTDGMTWLQA